MVKKDELFQLVRWVNLGIGLFYLYLWHFGGGFHLLGIGASNIAVWVFTRGDNWWGCDVWTVDWVNIWSYECLRW